MTDDTTHANLDLSSPDLSSAKVTFSLDPKTLLFQTHKSEDVSVFQNRVSLLEIHEVLMEINLNLIPRVKVIQRAYICYMIGLVFSSLLTLLMLIMRDMTFTVPVISSFVIVNIWLLGVMVIRKKMYDKVITRVLQDKEEAYHSNGLHWELKNYYFVLSRQPSCWLELKNSCLIDIDTTDRNARIDLKTETEPEQHEDNHQVPEDKLAEIFTLQKPPIVGSARTLQVASNFTLGPCVQKSLLNHNKPNYTAIDVGIVESNRVRKPSH